ncbi:LADA_0E06436g1_1 [Lachancea dasiensis]|uniref:LADA_0E06436g1_1 n=1 Tax=Lachancea dasiensis TaxID=1072105 RepID=A0A1G4JD48_9SACH|nr:LADA_0E06436g1_1 [Lachancea dasiensis]
MSARLKKTVLITQEDFYDDATAKEEQAERWALSDIKKIIRQYLSAFSSYEQGLNAPESTISGSYNIYYNQTRLLLKVHTDFIANEGHINILQYVNLTDLGDLKVLFRPLSSITERFEFAIAKFGDVCSWDLYFNLLTCYHSQLEDFTSLPGHIIIDLFQKFQELSLRLVHIHFEELESWSSAAAHEGEDQEPADSKDTSGQPPNSSGTVVDGESGFMEMQDEITPKTFIDTLAVCYGCIATLVELLIETHSGSLDAVSIVQANFLEEAVDNFKIQLDRHLNVVSSASFGERSSAVPPDTEELELAIWTIDGLRAVSMGGFAGLKTFLAPISEETADLCMNKYLIAVDLLQLVVQQTNGSEFPQVWAVRTEIGRILSAVETALAQKRQNIVSGRLKEMDNELSPTVFKLCDIMVSRSDNELHRYIMKSAATATDSTAAKTSDILLKNAKVLLKNAATISQQPCGFREYISDKLKRNFIYRQAADRLDYIENKSPAKEAILEICQDHPYYAQLRAKEK